nr:MAG TPA: Protein of unknown function (DUF2633) [Caudoviricetes sp.]DAW73235.1 MAG TPA: Protein of unknown function (DUF2633) [Caudoviricetes sp.]
MILISFIILFECFSYDSFYSEVIRSTSLL